ncbi:MAG: hypothetical protein Q7K40_04345 [bacterium]|nr:hypothetical protein [bacterium]
MKKLIGLISTKGKTSEQASKEVTDAFHKFNKIQKQVEIEMREEELSLTPQHECQK